jgi:hypothetical protein
LRPGLQVLERATAAAAEVGASRNHPFGRWPQDLDDHGFVMAPTATHTPQQHRLARQCAVDEHGLAVNARDAAAIVIQRNDLGGFRRGRRFQAAAHARAN